jgi:hypothetical protein
MTHRVDAYRLSPDLSLKAEDASRYTISDIVELGQNFMFLIYI